MKGKYNYLFNVINKAGLSLPIQCIRMNCHVISRLARAWAIQVIIMK